MQAHENTQRAVTLTCVRVIVGDIIRFGAKLKF